MLHDELNTNVKNRIDMFTKWANDVERHAKKLTGISQYIPARIEEYKEREGFWIYWESHGTTRSTLCISMPWQPNTADEIALLFGAFGWTCYLVEDGTNYHDMPIKKINMRHPYFMNAYVKILMDAENGNSKCSLVQVGTKETPLYQVRCND